MLINGYKDRGFFKTFFRVSIQLFIYHQILSVGWFVDSSQRKLTASSDTLFFNVSLLRDHLPSKSMFSAYILFMVTAKSHIV